MKKDLTLILVSLLFCSLMVSVSAQEKPLKFGYLVSPE
jgi:hypothetical protein